LEAFYALDCNTLLGIASLLWTVFSICLLWHVYPKCLHANMSIKTILKACIAVTTKLTKVISVLAVSCFAWQVITSGFKAKKVYEFLTIATSPYKFKATYSLTSFDD